MGIQEGGEISLTSSFALVCSISIGSGVLILSYGVMQAGLVLGILFMVLASGCGALTESIIIVSGLKLNARSLTSLIARTVAYSVIREKRQIMKKRRRGSEVEGGESDSIPDWETDRETRLGTPDGKARIVFSRKKLGRSFQEQPGKTTLGSVDGPDFEHLNWSEVSDLESSVSDLECVRNVLINNSVLLENFRAELKRRLLLHSRVLNIVVLILIGYCIPTYFILFTDYVEGLLKQLVHALSAGFADSESVLGAVRLLESLNNRVALSFLCFSLVIHSSCQPDISKIAKLGFLSIFSFVVFLLSVMYRYFVSPYAGALEIPPEPFELGPHMGLLQSMKVFIYAIYCFYSHLICVQAVASVRNPTFGKGIFIAVGTSFLMLLICSTLSVVLNLGFGTALLPNPTLNYSPLDPVISVARFVSALTMLVVIPMHAIPFIDSLKNIFFLDSLTDRMVNEVEEAMILIDRDSESKRLRQSQQSVSSYFTLIEDGPRPCSEPSSGLIERKSSFSPLARRPSFLAGFFGSPYFRLVATPVFLVLCIFLALVAKNAAQYVELFAGFFDTFIIIVYPLYIYANIWMHRMPRAVNFLVVGYLLAYEVSALVAGSYAVYEHLFLRH
ncbi:Transmembrane amino acid transporter protein [Cryptosporidium felis]|nr:Transmembrane amino acid transporter protein [Cryptosporidium felis]